MVMEDFKEAVKRLHEAKGWSQSRLIQEASGYAIPGTASVTIRNAVRGTRNWPSVVAIEAIARVLEVNPGEFPIYRLQLARRLLDPSEVGEATAFANADLLLSRMPPEEIAEEGGPPPPDTPDEDD